MIYYISKIYLYDWFNNARWILDDQEKIDIEKGENL